MVTTALLLFTVSTLAAQINAVPTKLKHDPCDGKALCFEKPADYPQEEIDRIVTQSDLRHLHRIKRETQLAFSNFNENNECVEKPKDGKFKMKPLFQLHDDRGIPRNVVQSLFFTQEFPDIKCRTKKSCFTNVFKDIIFECEPIKSRVALLILYKGDTEAKKMVREITTGCYCAEKKKN